MDAVIVGSGPSAAAAALALSQHDGTRITVLDIGGALEPERVQARSAMAATQPGGWQRQELDLIAALPAPSPSGKLPTKQIYGSNFPFQNFGQLDDIDADPGTNRLVVSGAYGGFSNTWGAQMMPFSSGTFTTWPISRADLEPHYRAVLEQVPFAGESDDLEETFPLMGSPDRLPGVSARTTAVLERYQHNRIALRGRGVTAGHARLALQGSACRRCGLCMTGCAYELIYSASQTFDRLRRSGRVDYRPGLRVHHVEEHESGRVRVSAVDTATGRMQTVTADRAFLAAGAIGTTRIVANSLGFTNRTVSLQESVQFVMPFLSARRVPELTQDNEFTLNQFNLFVSFDDNGKEAALIHCYPYNDIMLTSLPGFAMSKPFRTLTKAGLLRLTVGLGYLPSWASPSPQLRIGTAPKAGDLPSIHVSSRDNPSTGPLLKRVIRTLRKSGRALDLHPLPAQAKLSAPAKSYHYGGSFAMDGTPTGDFSSDLLGRVGPWRNVHLVDASVFPTVPATTFTLTIMANAHRIATDALRAA